MTSSRIKLEHLEWLVRRRSDVQRTLLDIMTFVERERSCLDADLKALGATHLLIGAGFSLWRAVFLGDTSLSVAGIAKNAERFLHTLIEDNAIGYTQDRSMRDWTFGYYVNNAAMRLGELRRRSSVYAEILGKRHGTGLDWQVLATRQPRKEWDASYEALYLAVENIDMVVSSLVPRKGKRK